MSARAVYVAAPTGWTGKSTVALGVVEALSRRVERVGVFRPVVRGDGRGGTRDYVLDLLVGHDAVGLSYDECAGVAYEDVHADPAAAMERIVERFHAVAAQSDAVVVVGSDFTDVGNPAEFAFNASVAANLGAPVLLTLGAAGLSAAELHTLATVTADELRGHHATLLGVVANRVTGGDDGMDRALAAARDAVTLGDAPGFALPDEPLLGAPSMGELAAAIDGRLVSGDAALLGTEVTGVVVAAMTLPHVLDRLLEGAVVVTPGDRPEIVLGVLMAQRSEGFPRSSGIVLNGGLDLPPQVGRLLDGLGSATPIVATDLGTHATTSALNDVRGRLTRDSPRKLATATALFAAHVDGDALLDRLELTPSATVTPLMFEHQLLDRAGASLQRIVLPEGLDERVLRAAEVVVRRGVARPVLLGDPRAVRARSAEVGVDLGDVEVVDPHDPELVERFAALYAERRAHRGVELADARELVVDVSYCGTLMVETGLADGMVSGAAHSTASTVRPALEVIRTPPGVSTVSSVFFMCLPDRVLVYGDCAINPDPTATQLADIALSSAETATAFGIEPRVAMLSYSTGTSGAGSDVDKVAEATRLVRERRPDLPVEGPIQYDAAIDSAVAATKLPGSTVAGQATVFVFPDLNTGNNTYKAVQRSAGAVAVGPVLQGLAKPVNDLSRGADVRDIVGTVAITAIQAQEMGAS
ncbi:phosphate acetyltransferase [Nocardioides sp. CFH 31398]|uniref:phosphate acetyltransferase n=1 Tax=Nocardioides sp. CFH 31398 TaxID=2919579 RepID=UPI001F0626EA|nr:phosphate acetyltransferase [Nocardioides sp. CFH 31398]MCH1865367.1 phosphate acetyltransferase [Nocardioides sp. CFH 31398]MCH1868751.1 phosphate acetyltransferase [Nocardioides sp. CFH 31398]